MKTYIKILSILLLLVTTLFLFGCYEQDPGTSINSSVTQNVIVDVNNSSTANILSGANFTGTRTSTLGIVGIQVSLKTNQNCTVYVQQSPDGTNWDISDSFSYIYSIGGNSWTVQAVDSYLRVIVKNIGFSATTYLRLQTCLCPIVEAVPRSLNPNGEFITDATLSDDYGFSVEDTPMGEMRVVEPVKLAGAPFIGNTIDTNFWVTSNSSNGRDSQTGGILTLSTFTSPNGAVTISSVRRARYMAGASMRYRAVVSMDSGVTNNVRRWGIGDYTALPTITDGAYFKLTGTTLGVATMKGGVETLVSSGSFNGKYGNTYVLDTNAHTYEIYWTNTRVYFVIDNYVLHTVTASTTTWSSTTTLYIFGSNINSAGLNSNIGLYFRALSIYRLGKLTSAPISKHITTGSTTVCKLGAGTLHAIIVGTPSNQTITIYDNTAGSGTVISVISLGNNTVPFELHFDTDFYTGLSITTSGTMDITVIYE